MGVTPCPTEDGSAAVAGVGTAVRAAVDEAVPLIRVLDDPVYTARDEDATGATDRLTAAAAAGRR